MSKIADTEANATSLDGLVNDNALVPTLRNGPKPSYQYLVDGWTSGINELTGNFAQESAEAFSEFNLTLDQYKESRGFNTKGTFAAGFTYEKPNDVGLDADGNPWAVIDDETLPVVVTAGTTPTNPPYKQVAYSTAAQVSTNTSDTVQSFIDSFALKIFQSPTDGGLTEIQTRTVNASEVYEVRKVSDDSLATIYSDAAGTTEIVQNSTDNKSGSDGVVEFYIADGDYYVEVSAVSAEFAVFNINAYIPTISISETSRIIKVGSSVRIGERGAVFDALALGATVNGYNTIGFNGCVLSLAEPFTLKKLGVTDGVDISTDLNNIIGIMIERGIVEGSRVKVKSLGFDDGTYLVNSTVNLLNIRDFNFYSVNGGKGAVTLDFSGMSNDGGITATHAAFGLWDGITFKDLVDNNNSVFYFGSTTGLIRGWDFKNCDFIANKRCFRVGGELLCSEFSFSDCDFLQCHTLMYNDNIQAVNWGFLNCNWENDSLVFAGDNAESNILFANKGTFLTWTGGSIIPQGGLVFCNWNAAGDAFRTPHKVIFNEVRVEIFPTKDSSNPPLVDRTVDGYVTASNSMPVSFINSSGLIRGGVVSPYVWANVWNKSSLSIVSSEFEAGEIHGLYDSNTISATGELIIDNNVTLTYVDDPSSKKSSAYINHFVDIKHDNSQDSEGFDINQRNATTVCSNSEKIIRLRSATGRIPLANTETILPEIPKNATVISIGYRRLQVANTAQPYTAELRSSDGVALYSTVTLANNQRVSDSDVLLESGIDIVTNLKVTFTGTPDIAYGYFEIRYV